MAAVTLELALIGDHGGEEVKDRWTIRRFVLEESLSDLYVADVEVSIPSDESVEVGDLLGRSCVVSLLRSEAMRERRCCGVIHKAAWKGTTGLNDAFVVEIVPALWALGQRTDSRIFEKKSLPSIAREVLAGDLKDYNRDVGPLPGGTYLERRYCAQYRESDLAFVNRLLQHEGVTYYFDHTGAEEKLVLADHDNANFPQLYEQKALEIEFSDGGSIAPETVSHIVDWHELRPTAETVRDWDWRAPQAPLEASEPDPPTGARQHYESQPNLTFAKPGAGDAKGQARTRLQAQQSPEHVLAGQSNVVGLKPGVQFQLSNADERDGNYVLTRVRHVYGVDLAGAGQRHLSTDDSPPWLWGDAETPATTAYSNSFECIPVDGVRYRPPRTIPWPTVTGPESGVVVGPSGQDVHPDDAPVYTDEDGLGLVQVRMHWDRRASANEQQAGEARTCWLRVAQAWAGPRYGTLFLPRPGMEVVVDFLEGNPDRPLVVGSLYNGHNAIGWEQPKHDAVSGIRTHSVGSKTGFNELSFDDTRGAEKVFLHAERDLDANVGHDMDVSVAKLYKEDVGNDETVDIQQVALRLVGALQYTHVHEYDANAVGLLLMRAVGGANGEVVGLGRIRVVGGLHAELVGGDMGAVVGFAEQDTALGRRGEWTVGDASYETGLGTYEVNGGELQVHTGRIHNIDLPFYLGGTVGAPIKSVSRNVSLKAGPVIGNVSVKTNLPSHDLARKRGGAIQLEAADKLSVKALRTVKLDALDMSNAGASLELGNGAATMKTANGQAKAGLTQQGSAEFEGTQLADFFVTKMSSGIGVAQSATTKQVVSYTPVYVAIWVPGPKPKPPPPPTGHGKPMDEVTKKEIPDWSWNSLRLDPVDEHYGTVESKHEDWWNYYLIYDKNEDDPKPKLNLSKLAEIVIQLRQLQLLVEQQPQRWNTAPNLRQVQVDAYTDAKPVRLDPASLGTTKWGLGEHSSLRANLRRTLLQLLKDPVQGFDVAAYNAALRSLRDPVALMNPDLGVPGNPQPADGFSRLQDPSVGWYWDGYAHMVKGSPSNAMAAQCRGDAAGHSPTQPLIGDCDGNLALSWARVWSLRQDLRVLWNQSVDAGRFKTLMQKLPDLAKQPNLQGAPGTWGDFPFQIVGQGHGIDWQDAQQWNGVNCPPHFVKNHDGYEQRKPNRKARHIDVHYQRLAGYRVEYTHHPYTIHVPAPPPPQPPPPSGHWKTLLDHYDPTVTTVVEPPPPPLPPVTTRNAVTLETDKVTIQGAGNKLVVESSGITLYTNMLNKSLV